MLVQPPIRLVVGVTGASGVQYALDFLQTCATLGLETHLVVSQGAARVFAAETDVSLAVIRAMASVWHDDRDLGASVASGSFPSLGMVVIPCTGGTLAKIAHGLADTLITRAAQVTLKERRPLVLVPREAPYSRPFLEAMLKAHDAGARIIPASPGFYARPETVEDLLGFITARVLDQFGLSNERSPRWTGGRGGEL